MLVAADRRHEAEERQLETPRHVLRRLDRVVHVVEAERHADGEHEPDGQRHQPRPAAGRRHRRLRNFGAIDDPHVVRAAVARDAQLLLPLEQRFVDLAVALRLALHHVVVDALAAQVLRRRPWRRRAPCDIVCSSSTAVSYSFLTLRARDVSDRAGAAPPARLRFHVEAAGMLFAVPLRAAWPSRCCSSASLPWPLTSARSARRPESCRARSPAGQRLDLVVQRLFLHAFALRLDDVVVQRVQPGQHDVLLVVERQGVLLVAVFGERALAVLDFLLLARQLLVQPRPACSACSAA